MKKGIKLHLNKLQWLTLADLLEQMPDKCPVENYEAESCLLAELYRRRLTTFKFYNPAGKLRLMHITLTLSEAFAINILFGDKSTDYNQYVRALLEPRLPIPKVIPEKLLTYSQHKLLEQ